MKGIVKACLSILIPFWLVYFVFYYIDVKYNTYFIMPIVLILFIFSIISLNRMIIHEEQKFKKRNNLSTYAYLYYSVIVFLMISFIFMFIFDYFTKKNGLIFNFYINEGDTDYYIYFLYNFYYYIKVLFPIVLLITTYYNRKQYRLNRKKKR
jgi:hypothetical protein